MNKRLSLFILSLSAWMSVTAQKGIEIGPWAGVSHYFGDLHTELALPDLRPAGGFGVRYNFDDRICAKGSINYARLTGSDANSINTYERQRGLSFYSNLWELNMQAEFNFLPYLHGTDDSWTPYLFAGVSGFSFSPKTKLGSDSRVFDLRQFGTEGQKIGEEYGRFSWAFSYGLGIKWDINYVWSINIEAGMRSAMTDYIDDVSGAYPDFDVMRQTRGVTAVGLSDPTGNAQKLRQRGNNKTKDSYILIGVGIMHYFGRLDCPTVSKR